MDLTNFLFVFVFAFLFGFTAHQYNLRNMAPEIKTTSPARAKRNIQIHLVASDDQAGLNVSCNSYALTLKGNPSATGGDILDWKSQ
jgi:hypothetical protein